MKKKTPSITVDLSKDVSLDDFDTDEIIEYLRDLDEDLLGDELGSCEDEDLISECEDRGICARSFKELKDQNKFDFFIENFDNITLEQLESLIN